MACSCRMTNPRFSNARSVRNAIERCRLRQAKRLVELQRPLTKDDLITINEQDVHGSSLFLHSNDAGIDNRVQSRTNSDATT